MPNVSVETIGVTVVNGALDFSPSSKTVYKDDQLQWICDHDAAFIFAGGRSPFTTKETFGSAPANTPIGPFTIKKKSKIKSKNKFKYTFIVHVGGGTPIIMEDPQVIIEDHGGDHPKKASKKGSSRKKKTTKSPKKVSRKAKK
jgi:hypothetical protein